MVYKLSLDLRSTKSAKASICRAFTVRAGPRLNTNQNDETNRRDDSLGALVFPGGGSRSDGDRLSLLAQSGPSCAPSVRPGQRSASLGDRPVSGPEGAVPGYLP